MRGRLRVAITGRPCSSALPYPIGSALLYLCRGQNVRDKKGAVRCSRREYRRPSMLTDVVAIHSAVSVVTVPASWGTRQSVGPWVMCESATAPSSLAGCDLSRMPL